MYPLQTYGEPVDEKAPIELWRLLKEEQPHEGNCLLPTM